MLYSQKKWLLYAHKFLYISNFLNIFILRTNSITSSLDVAFSLQIAVDHS